MSPRTCVLGIGLFIMLVAGSAWAQEEQTGMRYDDYKVVRVFADSWDQIDQLHDLGARLMSEGEGPGVVDYLLPPDALPGLESLGLTYKVLNDNVQKDIDAERALWEAQGVVAAQDPNWFTNYKDPNQVIAKLNAFHTDRPDLATVIDVGTSLQGRHIYGVRITGPGTNKPAVQFNGCHHAREWISVMVPMWIADKLVYTYDSDPNIHALVDAVEFFIIPVVNVDGYAYSWTTNRLWRKNRRQVGSCYGIDDNRNYSIGWGGAGSSGSPCDETYRGSAAFSEPETAAMRTFTLAHTNIVATQSYHSYSQLIMSPWGYTSASPPDAGVFADLDRAMHDAVFAVHGVGYGYGPIYTTIYPAAGGDVDWYYGHDPNHPIFAFTTELRDTGTYGFELPPDQIVPTCEENFSAAIYLAQWSSVPIQFSFPDRLPTRIDPNTPWNIRVRITALLAPLATSSPRLYARLGPTGSFTAYTLTTQDNRVFVATLPATPCGQTLYYYFTAQTTTGTLGQSPSTAPTVVYSVPALPPGSGTTHHDCNSNGVLDECDIAAGAPDCNGNGYPDDCDIAAGTSADCNSNGVPDECELAAGTATDCNSNGVLDECDRAHCTGAAWCSDCNSNGILDACDLVGHFAATSPAYTPLGYPTVQTFTLTAPPAALGDVLLTFSAYGDLFAQFNYVNVSVNGQALGTAYGGLGYFSCLPDQLDTLTVPMATYNTLKASGGGNVAIAMTPTSSMNPTACGSSPTTIKVTVTYSMAPLSQDVNSNGIPDECEHGACCFPNGSCTAGPHAACAGTYQGDGTTCTPNPCPQPTGACCFPNGSCTLVAQADCTGQWQGAGTTCTPNPCPRLCPGDMNCDGAITFADIDLFVQALSGESAWTHAPCPWLNGDCNGDHNVTFADIDPFVARIGTTCP